MIKAIVTRQNVDGTEDVGSRYVTGGYPSVEELLNNHQAPWHWEGSTVKYEFLHESLDEPFQINYVKV